MLVYRNRLSLLYGEFTECDGGKSNLRIDSDLKVVGALKQGLCSDTGACPRSVGVNDREGSATGADVAGLMLVSQLLSVGGDR